MEGNTQSFKCSNTVSRRLLREQELEKPISFSMDIESDVEDRKSSFRFLQEQENKMPHFTVCWKVAIFIYQYYIQD